jgi:AAA family ATP:ADP antiporter
VPHLQIRAGLPPGVDGWAMSLQGMMGLVVIGGLLITATYWLLNRTVVKKVRSRVLAAQLHRHEEGGAGCRGTLSFLRSFLLPVSSLSL